jgi:molybdenum cofactor synthesis domain-containing protein
VGNYRAAAVTVSNSVSAGTAPDGSGDVLAERLAGAGFDVVQRVVVPDGVESVSGVLRALGPQVDLIVTTGGTGLSPTDLTPEGTASVVHRAVPGISEALRHATFGKVPFGMLSRGIAGIADRCLIINLPGSPKAVSEGFDVLDDILTHAVAVASGDFGRHD